MGAKMSTRSKEIEKCPNFLTCSAPMCLFDPKVEICSWHPDEEICKRSSPPQWIKNQKKIKKKTRDMRGYFNFIMLNRNCIIGKGVVGLDPNRPEEGQLKSWLKKHPVKRQISDEEREIRRKRFERVIHRQNHKKRANL